MAVITMVRETDRGKARESDTAIVTDKKMH
jgi:hypothetical protein